jgi:hypothetical protein
MIGATLAVAQLGHDEATPVARELNAVIPDPQPLGY